MTRLNDSFVFGVNSLFLADGSRAWHGSRLLQPIRLKDKHKAAEMYLNDLTHCGNTIGRLDDMCS